MMRVWAALAAACALGSSGAAAQEQEPMLPRPAVQACSSNASQSALPERWRASYLMAPFTTGQLVLGDITYDASLPAMRVTLFGLRRGALDLLVVGTDTYLLDRSDGNSPACRRLGDTGWRLLPRNWLTPQSQCVGSAPIGVTDVDWWKTPAERAPAGYWIWTKTDDQTPFRVVFPSPSNRLAPLSRFAMSYQARFEPLQESGLGAMVETCAGHSSSHAEAAPQDLQQLIDAMESADDRADDAIASVMPALSACPAVPFTQWPEQAGITGFLTPFDVNQNPSPAEVIYDWTIPAQRTRTFFPPNAPVGARDALLLDGRGYDVTYRRGAGPVCTATLPGTVRPDWQDRAPCSCEAAIRAGTPLSPHGPTRVLRCPLASPRVAWAWYTLDGRPDVFMVTSLPGDEGAGLFAVFDYREWLPGTRAPRTAFETPPQCTAAASGNASAVPPAPSMQPRRDCATCHAGVPP
jgi:hypothetical protein